MRQIKKLKLNKEVVSILAGNEMNLVKGGMYSDAPLDSCFGPCGTNNAGCYGGTVIDCFGGVAGATCYPCATGAYTICNQQTCVTCKETCPDGCGGPYHTTPMGLC